MQTARARLAGPACHRGADQLPLCRTSSGAAWASRTINGALLDLGVSSHQLDDAARGFSYRADAPLDMRMSQEGETAADLVNSESREELARILRDYGEEPFAWQIAGRIVEARETAPIETTLQLADIVASAMPPAERRKNKNPSRRTFQALRIAVNHELDALEEGLDTIFDASRTGWKTVRDHLPLAGGPAGQKQVPPLVHRLHLPAGVPGVRLRRQGQGKADHTQTH